MRHFSIYIITLLLFSCSESKETPENILSEDQFVEVLTEFQLTESIVRLGYHRTDDSLHHNDSLYNAMFRKMNVSRVDFDSNYNYYVKDPETFSKIYEKVITNLSKESAELDQKKEKNLNPQKKAKKK